MHKRRIYQHQSTDPRRYARVEWLILDLQLGISSVRRADDCLDLETVRRTRLRAAATLRSADVLLAQLQVEPSQARRIAEQQQRLGALLRDPAPIERLARILRVA